MHIPLEELRNIYQSHALDLLRNCLSGQDGGCKQRGQPAMISLKTRCLCPDKRFAVAIYIGTGLTGPYSAIQWRCQCSAELGWPSHSMCSSPHWQVGQSWFREKLSPANREQRLSRWADFAKNCLPRIRSKVLPRFREKYRALGRQKMGSNMRPRYIQFRDIHDRDISGLHCILKSLN